MKDDIIATLLDLCTQILNAILDSLEQAIDIFTISSGKRVYQVFYVTIGFLIISILCQLVDIPIFISWKEALVAVIFMGIVSTIELHNQGAISKFKDVAVKKISKANGNGQTKSNKSKKKPKK